MVALSHRDGLPKVSRRSPEPLRRRAPSLRSHLVSFSSLISRQSSLFVLPDSLSSAELDLRLGALRRLRLDSRPCSPSRRLHRRLMTGGFREPPPGSPIGSLRVHLRRRRPRRTTRRTNRPTNHPTRPNVHPRPPNRTTPRTSRPRRPSKRRSSAASIDAFDDSGSTCQTPPAPRAFSPRRWW